jgi:arabinofuranosyltransferase
VLVYPGPTRSYTTPLNRRGVPVATVASLLGSFGAILPLNDIAIDPHGLSYPYASHMQVDPIGRIGHAKLIGVPWVVADYGTSTHAPGVDPAQVAAARRALRCGDMALLGRATTAPLTWGQFWSNVAHSVTLTKFRVPNDPVQAERQLCGSR